MVDGVCVLIFLTLRLGRCVREVEWCIISGIVRRTKLHARLTETLRMLFTYTFSSHVNRVRYSSEFLPSLLWTHPNHSQLIQNRCILYMMRVHRIYDGKCFEERGKKRLIA